MVCILTKVLQQICMTSKNKSAKERRKIKSMHNINSKQPTLNKFLNEYLWVDTFERKSSGSDDDEDQVLFYLFIIIQTLFFLSNTRTRLSSKAQILPIHIFPHSAHLFFPQSILNLLTATLMFCHILILFYKVYKDLHFFN